MISQETVTRFLSEIPDLQTQLESILDCVWRCEREWALDDRIDCALKVRS